MNRTENFLIILVLGSLWGFFEMISLPVWILCSLGILFLVIGRKLINIPGTSLLIGLVVCFYKTYGDNFFICQWAGVLSLAGSFDFFTSLVFKLNWQKPIWNGVNGFLSNISALIVFVFLMVIVFKEQYWVDEGFERVLNYATNSMIPAAIVSGVITSHVGLYLGSLIQKYSVSISRKLIPGIYLTATILLWLAASFN